MQLNAPCVISPESMFTVRFIKSLQIQWRKQQAIFMCKSYFSGWLCTYQFIVIFWVFFLTNNESWGVTHCCLKLNPIAISQFLSLRNVHSKGWLRIIFYSWRRYKIISKFIVVLQSFRTWIETNIFKNTICSLLDISVSRHFGGICCLYLQVKITFRWLLN